MPESLDRDRDLRDCACCGKDCEPGTITTYSAGHGPGPTLDVCEDCMEVFRRDPSSSDWPAVASDLMGELRFFKLVEWVAERQRVERELESAIRNKLADRLIAEELPERAVMLGMLRAIRNQADDFLAKVDGPESDRVYDRGEPVEIFRHLSETVGRALEDRGSGDTKLYLLKVEGVEAELIGPYAKSEEWTEKAQAIRDEQDPESDHLHAFALSGEGELVLSLTPGCDREPCSGCKEFVNNGDDYYASPCGTYCPSCMEKHMKDCEVCRGEYE